LDTIRFENGKSTDIKHAFKGQKVCIFDLSRSQETHVNYEVIESIKNGVVFSPKYESRCAVYSIPHLIVFANFEPDKSKLSADRWDIRTISVEDNEWAEVAQVESVDTVEDMFSRTQDTVILNYDNTLCEGQDCTRIGCEVCGVFTWDVEYFPAKQENIENDETNPIVID
jgi:hypothetical protein